MSMYNVYGVVVASGPSLAFITGFQDSESPWLRVMRRLPVGFDWAAARTDVDDGSTMVAAESALSPDELIVVLASGVAA